MFGWGHEQKLPPAGIIQIATPSPRSLRAYSVEKLPNWGFEDFRQKHTLSETSRELPRKVPRRRAGGRKPISAEPLAKIIWLLCVGKYFQNLLEIGVFQQNMLQAAVRQISNIDGSRSAQRTFYHLVV